MDASKLFEHSHKELHDRKEEGMLSGRNSAAVETLFSKADPHFRDFLKFTGCASEMVESSCLLSREALVREAHESQQLFVKLMDTIVFQYSEEGDAATQLISRMEWILGGLALILLLVEYRYIFRPTGFLI